MADGGTTWEQWVARHGPAALLFARQITHSAADAEDAVQDGFVRFWQHRERARDAAALLFASIRSAALDLRRAAKRRRAREQKVAENRPLFATLDNETPERARAIEQALAGLPENQREVVVLKIWAGLTMAQIATALGESPNTLASRYRYALEKLSAILSPEVPHER